jgi:predicted transcriptional regulator
VVKGGRVIGLLERHAAAPARPSGCGDRSGPIRVAGLMRRGVFVCRADDPLERALATMDRLEVGLLAVVDGAGRVVGAIGRDAEDDPLRRLVPAFYGSY